MKTLLYKVIGVLQQDETGDPAQVGDQVKLFLDQSANPELPEFVFGIIQPGIRKAGCCDDYTVYRITYELAEFYLRPDDVINITTTAAVDVVAQELLEETERAIAVEEQLQENIDAEETARIAADNAEAATRLAADNALSARTTTLENDAVRYTSQAKSDGSKEIARSNIGMANRTLLDSSNASSVNWGDRFLLSFNGEISLDWESRQFVDTSGTVTASWANGLELYDGTNIITGTTTGSTIGTTVSQKLAFHGAAPVIQRANANQAAVVTTTATQTTPWGFSTQAQANAIITLLNEIRTTLVEKGIMKGSA